MATKLTRPKAKLTFASKIGGFIAKPVDTFKAVKAERAVHAFRYFALILVIYSVIVGLLLGVALIFITKLITAEEFAALAPALPIPIFELGRLVPLLIPLAIVVLYGIGWLLFLLGGLIIHLGVLIFARPHKVLGETYKALAYGSTPMIFGFVALIPLVGSALSLLLGIWALILQIIGIKEFHETSVGRSIAAALVIPIAIVIILVLIIAALILTQIPFT